MSTALTIDDVIAAPEQLTTQLVAGDGSEFASRLLLSSDTAALGRYLDGLGPSVRNVYGPHPLNADHAAILCAELDYHRLMPFLAVDGDDIVGYFLIHVGLQEVDDQRYVGHGHRLNDSECFTLAPCVSDAWQHRGLGSALFPHVADCLRRLGGKRLVLWGGVRGDNPRAQHFYRKFGFRHVGDFEAKNINNLDMVMDL